MKKKILVTGGMGYIGSHTIIELLKQYEVVSADSCINSSPQTADQIAAISGIRVKNYQIDLCNKEAVQAMFVEEGEIAGIIHFAALKSVPNSVDDPMGYYRNNLLSLANMLEACQQYDVHHFIFSSSCSVYGNVEMLPVSEDTPLKKAESPYAYTKQIGEVMMQDFVKVDSRLNCISLRYFNPVGAHESGLNGENPTNPPTALVPYITQTAVGIFKQLTVFGTDYDTRDGSCVRDYIHVTDLAEAHIKALEYLMEGRNTERYEVFNLGSGNGVTVLEAINAFIAVTGEKLPYTLGPRRPGDVEAIYSNSEKAHRLLGWQPKLGIDEMMRSSWKWQTYLRDGK